MTASSSLNHGGFTPSRIRVWCDELQTSAWVLVPRTAATVSEVAASIAEKLGLEKTDNAFNIFMDDALVLPSEEARLIRDGDVVAIRNKRPSSERDLAPRKKLKTIAGLAAVIPVPQEQQTHVPVPVNTENGLEVPRRMKLRSRTREDILTHTRDPRSSHATVEEDVENKTAFSPLKRTESASTPAYSHADLNLKRPFQEKRSATISPTGGEPTLKLTNLNKKGDMQATSPSAQAGPYTGKKPDFQQPSFEQVKVQMATKLAKVLKPCELGGPAVHGSAVSPASSAPPKSSALETTAPASTSGEQKPQFGVPPSTSSAGLKKAPIDSALSTSALGRKQLVFAPTPRKEKPEVQNDAIQGRKPSRPSFAEAVSNTGLSKKVSAILAGTHDFSRSPAVPAKPEKKDNPAPGTKKMSRQRLAKPTNIYSAGRRHAADRGQNVSRVRHGSNSSPGDDSTKDVGAVADRERNTWRTHDSGRNREHNDGQNCNTSKEYGADRHRQSKAFEESQHNESFYVGLDLNSGNTSEGYVLSSTKSKAANKEKPKSDAADNAEIEETKKDLMELLGKGKSEKPIKILTAHEDLSRHVPDNAATKAPFAVCENHASAGSCTILDMLRNGPPGGNDDSGVYCRVQVLLGFGSSEKTTQEPSKWISLMLAARPTRTNDLRVSKVNEEALSVLRRAGRAAKQRSRGTTFDRRGANLKEYLPIFLDPNAIHKFSFDIRNHVTDDSIELQTGVDGVGCVNALLEEDMHVKESAKCSSFDTRVDEPEVKTGYENLRSRIDKASREEMSRSLALDELPIIDIIPGDTTDLGTGLDVTDYPPLEDVDSVLDTLNGIELDHDAGDTAAVHTADGQPSQKESRKEDNLVVNPKITRTPNSAPPRDGSDGDGVVSQNPGVEIFRSHPCNVLSPDSVIDLVEEPREVDFTKRNNANFRTDYRGFMFNVLTDVTATLKTLTERDDLHLSRFSTSTS